MQLPIHYVLRLSTAALILAGVASAGTTPTSVTLTSSQNPALYGQVVTLSAAVSSGSATGRVTFYDGVTVLDTIRLSGGLATLFTIALPAGTSSLWAYYSGDAAYAPSKSAAVSETVSATAGLFQAPVTVNSNDGGMIVTGDFNGDGRSDIVVGGTAVFLGNGDGTFQPPLDFSVGHCFFPRSTAIGDFNGDGKLDLAVGESCSGVNILLGNGDGTFQAPISYITNEVNQSIAVADFNGDGNADFVASNDCLGVFCGGQSTTTDVFLGNGDGTFRQGAIYPAGGVVVVGDFNGDGKADLAVGKTYASSYLSNLSVYLGNGDGTFQTPLPHDAGLPIDLTVGDYNGDGKADLAVANLDTNNNWNVIVFMGKGDGTFNEPTTYAAGGYPNQQFLARFLASGDYNGDGKLDLAVTNALGFSILSGNGDGTFQSAVAYFEEAAGSAIAASSFTNDGRTDLSVTLGSSLSVIMSNTPRPDLTISSAHAGNFTQGQTGSYAVTVTNIGSGPTSGLVTVIDSPPTGLTATAISGLGWTCVLSTATCTRSDLLAISASYPAITVAVNVSASAATSVTNTATVSGGGETTTANDSASDPTLINITEAGQTITFAAIGSELIGTPPFALTAKASSGLAINYISTTAATCTVSAGTVTLIAIGTCSITATQGGNSTYAAATPVTQSFSVKYPQTITFGALGNVMLLSPPFSVTAIASSGLPVSFTSTSPSICTVSGNNITSVAAGVCSITAGQAGNTSYAAAVPVTQSFTIVGPIISSGGVVPLFSSVNTLEPGSWISIYGTNLVPTSATWTGSFQNSTSLGGVSVTIDGKLAYISSVTKGTPPNPDQINMEAPDDTVTGSVPVVVTNSLGSGSSTVTLATFAPSFSLLDNEHVAGIILTPNGMGAYDSGAYDIVGPVGAFPYPTRPVKPGETLVLYGVGFGPTSPAVPAGVPFSGAAGAANNITMTIGGVSVPISFEGISYTGQYQFNVVMPSAPSGDQPIVANVGGVQSPANFVITVY